MSEAINLEFIGSTLRSIQAEQRTLRSENELLRSEIGRLAGAMATRDTIMEVLRLIMERIGNFEALMETRIDMLSGQVATIAAAVTPKP
jgi:prefoldin subunit 5